MLTTLCHFNNLANKCICAIIQNRYRAYSLTCSLPQIRLTATIVIFKTKQKKKICMEGNISIFCSGNGARQDVKQSHHHRQNTTRDFSITPPLHSTTYTQGSGADHWFLLMSKDTKFTVKFFLFAFYLFSGFSTFWFYSNLFEHIIANT